MSGGVRIRSLKLAPLVIPLKTSFRHASAERAETSSLFVEAVSERGTVGYGESCPRPYVTDETLETGRAFFDRHEPSIREVEGLSSVRAWMAAHAEEVVANPAAWCAIELALLDLMARESGRTVEQFLSLPALSGRFRYTAVLGDAEREAFETTALRYREHGFRDFKVKLSGDLARDRDKIDVLRHLGIDALRVRVDANNLWAGGDEALEFLRALEFRFFAVEEPIRPGQYGELARLGEALDCPMILDESFRRLSQLELLGDPPARWLINLRVSKMGGLLRSLPIVDAARSRGIGLIVGAQVGETSLLTRAALTVANLGREGLVAQEGAFGTLLLEHDVCDPPLMFGAGGELDTAAYPSLSGAGFGLRVVRGPGVGD